MRLHNENNELYGLINILHIGIIDFIKQEVGKLHSFKSMYDFESKSFVKVIGQKVTTPSPADWQSVPDQSNDYEEEEQKLYNFQHTLQNVIVLHEDDLA